MIEKLEKLLNSMYNDEIVSLNGLDVSDVSKLLALLKADKAYMDALDAHINICFGKTKKKPE